MASASDSDIRRLSMRWLATGALLVAFAVAATLSSPGFGDAVEVIDMPVLWLAGGLVLAGLAYLALVPHLISQSIDRAPADTRRLLFVIFGIGLAARLILFASEPMLEDDYQRYLWDGAVTVSGHNPYAVAPATAAGLDGTSDLGRLAREAGAVLDRVNHPDLKTIYPPVAQAAFALAHLLGPYNLAAWRTVILACDLATLGLIVLLLQACGRSPLWSALYWWNPLLLKELFNSAHMDAIVLPLVMGALLLAARGRPVASASVLALAAGAKVWPVLLLPLILRAAAGPRPDLNDARRAAMATTAFLAISAAALVPIVWGGLDPTSGFVAYAQNWYASSALFPVIEQVAGRAAGMIGASDEAAGVIARSLVAAGLVALAIGISRAAIPSPDALMGRAAMMVAALLLVSPTQFPWYFSWLLPFLAFRPWWGLLGLTVTMPLYYVFFHYAARAELEAFYSVTVWAIWLPVWAALAFEAVWRPSALRAI